MLKKSLENLVQFTDPEDLPSRRFLEDGSSAADVVAADVKATDDGVAMEVEGGDSEEGEEAGEGNEDEETTHVKKGSRRKKTG